jgi:bifunctional non-homologous end joining protein LigD
MSSRTTTRRKSARPRKPAASPSTLTVRLTHPDRVIYADGGITKRDLALYYAAVWPWIEPHVAGRPLVLVRCPEGARGNCFFQKHPPAGLPEAVQRIEIRDKNETGIYVWVRDLEGLIALIQFGTLEIHAWGSTVEDIEHPDRLIFDLDPDPTVSWKQVLDAARAMRDYLADLKLNTFVKTTGGKGLHVVAPLGQKQTWDEVKGFARAVAEEFVRKDPARFIATASKAARRGKIFIDYLRNQRGASSVVAYSTRARPGAPVSAPLAWNELAKLRSAAQFTLQNLPTHLARLRRDPWAEIFKTRRGNQQRLPSSISIEKL